MKEPFEIGTFLHRAEKYSCRNRILLICGYAKNKNSWKYKVASFSYYPNIISERLDRFGASYYTISSFAFKNENWQIVDVSKGEVAQ